MDNITHTLIGLAVGEAVAAHRKKARLPIWIASAAANNLPDSDLVLTTFFFPGRLGYLLHHRGHTHTLLGALALGVLLLLGVWLYGRRRADFPWREMVFVTLLGSLLHILADSWNSYGVHPFWPLNQEWFYGDMMFIVEPWIWVCLLPPLFFACATRWGKGACAALLLFILGLSWQHEYVARPAALALTLAAAAHFFLQWRLSRGRIWFGISGVTILLAGLFLLSGRIEREYARPGQELVLSPQPANPLCWNLLRAGVNGEGYVAESLVVAPFPSLLSAERCSAFTNAEVTVPLDKSGASQLPQSRHLGAFRAPAAELSALTRDCRVNAFLRFARIPFWLRKENGWVVGDMRYDREEGLGFAEFFFADADSADCPRGVPPWLGRFHPDRAKP